MIKPEVLTPEDDVTLIAHIFEAPLVTKGWSWFPLTQLITWLIMAREAGRVHPDRSWFQRFKVAAVTMPILLGSEWCHNLAHAAAAKWVGKPVDVIRVNLGMPLLVYYDLEDPTVTPRQHVFRSLGGPLVNLIFLAVSGSLHRFTAFGSIARDAVDAARGVNLTLLLAGLLPQPWLDGGAALKWVMVEKGQTLEKAEETVRVVNGAMAVGLGIAAVTALKRSKKTLGVFLGAMTALSIGVAVGALREKA
jgi:Zn-dependent protease